MYAGGRSAGWVGLAVLALLLVGGLVVAGYAAFVTGKMGSGEKPVKVLMLSSPRLGMVSGEQGVQEVAKWFKVTRSSGNVTAARLEVSLGNAGQLRKLYDYLDIVLYIYGIKTIKLSPQVLLLSGGGQIASTSVTFKDKVKLVAQKLESQGYSIGPFTSEELADLYLKRLSDCNITIVASNGTRVSGICSRDYPLLLEALKSDKSVTLILALKNGVWHPYVKVERPEFSYVINSYGNPQNYTLIWTFIDSRGNTLLELKFDVTFTDNGNSITVNEYGRIGIPELGPRQQLGMVSLDAPVTSITLDAGSWGDLDGNSVIVGAKVYYEVREGASFESVPIQLNVKLVGVS